jgi:hypothetical protein
MRTRIQLVDLATTVTVEDLRRLCSVFGTVRSVSRDGDGGMVEMSSEQDTTLCVQRLSGHNFKGRELVLRKRAIVSLPVAHDSGPAPEGRLQ